MEVVLILLLKCEFMAKGNTIEHRANKKEMACGGQPPFRQERKGTREKPVVRIRFLRVSTVRWIVHGTRSHSFSSTLFYI
jgi:hypothetical protein